LAIIIEATGSVPPELQTDNRAARKPPGREPADFLFGLLAFQYRNPLRFANAIPAAPLPHDPIKAAARYTTKYLIFHLGAHPATPNASAHIVAPHTAFCLSIRDTPIIACLVVVWAFRQTSCKAKSLAF